MNTDSLGLGLKSIISLKLLLAAALVGKQKERTEQERDTSRLFFNQS